MLTDNKKAAKKKSIEGQQSKVGHLDSLKQLASIQTASTSIISKLELGEVLNTVTREITHLLNATACALDEWDVEKNVLRVISEHWPKGWGNVELETNEYPVDDYPSIKKTLVEKQEVQIFVSDKDLSQIEIEMLQKAKSKSLLYLPLVFQDRVVGLVKLYDSEERKYESQEIIIAKMLTNLAAIAIENARLFTETKKNAEEQMALRESALAISSSLDLNTTLTQIAEQICKLIDATSAYVSEFDLETKTSSVIAEYYSPSASDKERDSDLGGVYNHTYEFSEVIEAMETGQTDVFHYGDPNLKEESVALMDNFDCKSAMEIPIKVGKDFTAFIEIWESRKKRIFTKNEISLCQTFATQAGIAINNARLFEMAQKEIERRELLEEKLQHDALHDVLTNLPNRTLFLDRLGHVIKRNKRIGKELFAVLLVDLDKLKIVNDTMGHLAGDELLARTARLLEECVREADTVSRYGGDEFLILLEGVEGIDDVTHISKRIQEKISTPLEIQGNEILVSASTGIVMSSSEYVNPEEYIRDADIAMYHVKMQGKGRYQVFSDDLRNSYFKRLTLESDIQRAIKYEEFELHYQPILSLATRKIEGFEALLRWERSPLGLIYPNEFIPLAEETGHIVELGYWAIREASKQLFKWHGEYPQIPQWQMSINISSKQLYQSDFVENVEKIINEIGVNPGKLIFEITESVYIGETAFVAKTLKKLQSFGIKIHLDDFGTGYSALSYIDDFPIDALKIASSFMNSFNPEENKRGMIHTIIRMAQDFGLVIVAEGIATIEQVKKLGDIGCQFGQGFIFSPGRKPEELNKFIEEHT